MPDKTLRITRAAGRSPVNRRPVMLGIAGDSAAGKTTLAAGLVEAIGPQRCVSLCTDDYHRYDREERRDKPFTALHPDCNYLGIMEQHLQLLASGQPVLKPVYDHATGRLTRPELVEPNDFIIVEGLLPLHSKLARACFDVTVFLDPDEPTRRGWKIERDTRGRGYDAAAVLAELDRREPESQAYIRPQRRHADIVVRFAPVEGRDDPGCRCRPSCCCVRRSAIPTSTRSRNRACTAPCTCGSTATRTAGPSTPCTCTGTSSGRRASRWRRRSGPRSANRCPAPPSAWDGWGAPAAASRSRSPSCSCCTTSSRRAARPPAGSRTPRTRLPSGAFVAVSPPGG
ncbi:phosphoribulokinase [Pseudonocardia benzenivorans]